MTAAAPGRMRVVNDPLGSSPEPEIKPEVRIEDAPARIIRLQKRLGYNVPAITLVLLTELGVDGVAHQVLYPLIADRVHHILREKARSDYDSSQRRRDAGDKRARAGGQVVPRSQAVTTPDTSSRLAFLEFKVIMAGVPGGFKQYKDLTVAEHASRQLMMERSAAPVLHSARSHRWAKETCERHKVMKLADLPRDVLERELPKEGVRP